MMMAVGLPVVLLCCHNRKAKTLQCLHSLYAQGVALRVVLVDDGSTDGTAAAVRAQFAQVELLQGNGQLYWTGAMRMAWQHALSLQPAACGFIWLNDDVLLDNDAIPRLLAVIALLNSQPFGAVTCAMRDPQSGHLSYGGRCSASRWWPLKMTPLLPLSNQLQRCDFINGNLCYIPAAAVAAVGILSEQFTHSLGDYDYGLRLGKAGLPCYVAPGSFGLCADNPPVGGVLDKQVPLAKRLSMLAQPNRWVPANEYRQFVRRHGGPFQLLLQLQVLLRQWFPRLFLLLRQRDFTAGTTARRPKLYQLHQQYRQKGGEDVVVAREASLLQQVQLAAVTPEAAVEPAVALQQILLPPLSNGLWAQLKAIAGWFGCWRLPKALQGLQPGDLLLVHNLFPAVSPFVLPRLSRRGVRVVLTIHNFRPLTPAAVLAAHENAQTPTGALIWQQWRKPGRSEGRLLSILLAAAIVWQHRCRVWQQVALLCCPSEFVRRQYLAAGYPAALLQVKPHYYPSMLPLQSTVEAVAAPLHTERLPDQPARQLLLFVGREHRQKGLALLLQAYQHADASWPDLYLAGVTADVGMQPQSQAGMAGMAKVHYTGQLSQAALSQLYQQALLVIVPSLVAETFGNVVIEAFAHGAPVLAANSGALAELVQVGHNGSLFEAGNVADLHKQLAGLLAKPALLAQLSTGARQSYLSQFREAQQWPFYQTLGVSPVLKG